VDGATRAERLDQGALLPERALHTGAGRPGDAPPDGEFGGAEHLRVRAAEQGGDGGRVEFRGRFGQRVPRHPPGRDAAPGQGGRGPGHVAAFYEPTVSGSLPVAPSLQAMIVLFWDGTRSARR